MGTQACLPHRAVRVSLLQGQWEWVPRGQPRKGPASLHPAGIMPLNDKRSSPATGSEQSLVAPSESFVFPFQRVLARTAQMPLSLLVAPELGFHPWPGPRCRLIFSSGRSCSFCVCRGPVASSAVGAALEGQAGTSGRSPSLERVLLAAVEMALG